MNDGYSSVYIATVLNSLQKRVETSFNQMNLKKEGDVKNIYNETLGFIRERYVVNKKDAAILLDHIAAVCLVNEILGLLDFQCYPISGEQLDQSQ